MELDSDCPAPAKNGGGKKKVAGKDREEGAGRSFVQG